MRCKAVCTTVSILYHIFIQDHVSLCQALYAARSQKQTLCHAVAVALTPPLLSNSHSLLAEVTDEQTHWCVKYGGNSQSARPVWQACVLLL